MKRSPGISRLAAFFFQPYRTRLIGVLILLIVVGVLEAASIAAVYPILSEAFAGGFARAGFVLSAFGTLAGILPVADEFIAYCLLFIILAFVTFVLKLLSVRARLTLSAGMVERNHNDIFSRYMQADYQHFVDHKEGELIYNTITAPHSLQILVVASTELFTQAILSVTVFFLLFSLTWQGTVVVVVMGVLYFLFTHYLAGKVAYHAGRRQAEALTESLVVLNEVFGGIKQVKVFDIAGDWIKKFAGSIKRHWYYYVKRSNWQQSLNPLLILLLYFLVATIAIVIRVMFPDSFDDLIPVFGTFAFAVFRLVPIIGSASNATMEINGALPNCQRVYNVLHERLATGSDGSKELDSFTSGIAFENVTFTYSQRDVILKDISVTFEKGSTTAIVGRSGSGKTTIVNLILRLFEFDEGAIKIDGVDIREYRIASWLEKIGFVSQETFVFNDTIRNNITFGSKRSDEEIEKVSRYADAHSFIMQMPDGYDTLVGDKGMRLSGGQRQRIAVARAMVRHPEILIFDEATNALDTISEAAVQRAIDEISKDHTVIIIAHRLSTVINADKIIVLGDGRVLEEGTHRELMARGGAYSELYRSKAGN